MKNYWLDEARATNQGAKGADQNNDKQLSTCKCNNKYTDSLYIQRARAYVSIYIRDDALWISQSLTRSYLACLPPSQALMSSSSTISSSLASFLVCKASWC